MRTVVHAGDSTHRVNRAGLATAFLVVSVGMTVAGFPVGAPVLVNPYGETDTTGDKNRTLATDGRGTWLIVWGSQEAIVDGSGNTGTDWDVFCARSTDDGASWIFLGPVNSHAYTDDHTDGAPAIATDGNGTWVVAWGSLYPLDGIGAADADILYARSTDDGDTWSVPKALNSTAYEDAGTDQNVRLATDRNGAWVAVWQAQGDPGGLGIDDDILVARSSNNAADWGNAQPLNNNAAVDVGDDGIPFVATDGVGHWVTVWSSDDDLQDVLGEDIGNDLDVLFAGSVDNGATWTNPAPLNTNASTDDGFDDFPSIAMDHDGNWVAVWMSNDTLGGTIPPDADILTARSTGDWMTWSPPARLSDDGSEDVPWIATDHDGIWTVVWGSRNNPGATLGDDLDILTRISVDTGSTWCPPQALNSNATMDGGSDDHPVVVSDAGGNWIAAWQSTELGGDYDIFAAGFSLGTDPSDSDSDGLADFCDNCPGEYNADQIDGDWDGFGDACDCDDASPDTYRGAAPHDSPTACMKDADGDDWGDNAPPPGVAPGTDCDDTDAYAYPNAAERCNGGDDNCNGLTDEGNPEGGGSCSTEESGVCAFGSFVCCTEDVLANDVDCVLGSLLCQRDFGPAPEDCFNGLDDDCDGNIDESEDPDGDGIGNCVPDNCPDAYNTDQTDADSDGIGDVCDCAPLDSINESPVEVGSTLKDFSHDQSTGSTILRWTDETAPGPYRLYRGWRKQGVEWAYQHYCVGLPIDGEEVEDALQPLAYTTFYYLVTRVGCGESIAGRDSAGDPIPNLDPCPSTGTDADGDGVEEAIDTCAGYANPSQADLDGDSHGDVCDNCPYLLNPAQEDLDADGLGNACDPDIDGDGVFDDGDGSGTAGDHPCTGGDTENCDDNCPYVGNADQVDGDSDGVGDACDPE